jgi:hypothetical protein
MALESTTARRREWRPDHRKAVFQARQGRTRGEIGIRIEEPEGWA